MNTCADRKASVAAVVTAVIAMVWPMAGCAAQTSELDRRPIGVKPEPLGQLQDVPLDADGQRYDEGVPAEFRGACATAAVWRFASGGIGSLVHGALLHGGKYESELEVWADGLRLVLVDPYRDCRLLVRRPHSEETEVMRFPEDDSYLAEDAAFVEALRTRDRTKIRSPYGDAFRTFELTWAIADTASA